MMMLRRICGAMISLTEPDYALSVGDSEAREKPAMATNAPAGDNHRNGAIRKRSQLKTKVMGEQTYTKRSKATGQFMDQKADGKKFKGVRKEKRH